MASEYDDDQFDGFVSANNKNRYDYFNDIQPEQNETQIHNASLFPVTQIPLYTSQNTQQIPDISILYQNQPFNQQSLFNPNLQSNSSIQNDIQQNHIFSIPQIQNTVQHESTNSNGHFNYQFQQQQQQSNQVYEEEEFQDGEFIELQKPVEIQQISFSEVQSKIQINEQQFIKNNNNQEQKDLLFDFEMSTNQVITNHQQQQQNIQAIPQEPKKQIQLSSIYDAFPSEQNEMLSSLQPSPLLQIPQSQQENQNDQQITKKLNLIEMYEKTLTLPINDQQIIQNGESKQDVSQQKIELFNLIDFNTQSNQAHQQQHFEYKANSLLSFQNEKIEQQQLDVQQQHQQLFNNTQQFYNDFNIDQSTSQQQNQIILNQTQNYQLNFQNENLIDIKNIENLQIQEETKIVNQEVQNIQSNINQILLSNINQECNNNNNDDDEFDEFVEGEQIESPVENNLQNQNVQITNSTYINQQDPVFQNSQVIPQDQMFSSIQQQLDQSSSQKQIQFQQNNQVDLKNIYLTQEINIKQGPLRQEPIKKRNWRNQIEDIVGFDAECMDSFMEELCDLKLHLYKAQVQEYAQLANDIQALRKKKQIHVDKEEYEEATVIRDTLRAKEPIAMVLKKKILQIAQVIDLMDQQDLDYHIKKYIFDHQNEIPENPSIDMLLPKIQIIEDFVEKLKKELKKSESVLSIIKLQGQLEKVRYEKKYQIFIQGLRKIIGMSYRFQQLSEFVQSVNDRLSDLKIDKEVNKLDYEFIFENTLIPFLKGQQQQQNYCNYCFQSKQDLIEYKGKLYDVCCLNFYYNIN
ncbi:unnamed protein product [Paramecium sonneborni]|uniref:UVR domain-containing protein n=1 Tax=Paramecium sonneborni TaxID=65129 RepID=A0A8S1NFE9_9CILI|nr:unnamed protein product [Paramecium sonneborni]